MKHPVKAASRCFTGGFWEVPDSSIGIFPQAITSHGKQFFVKISSESKSHLKTKGAVSKHTWEEPETMKQPKEILNIFKRKERTPGGDKLTSPQNSNANCTNERKSREVKSQ